MRHNIDPIMRYIVAPSMAVTAALGMAGCAEAKVVPPPAAEAPASPEPTTPTSPETLPPPAPNKELDVRKYKVTWYGEADNNPPGTATVAHPNIRAKAGGTGTYADPQTLAVIEGLPGLTPGDKLYSPDLEKYFEFADDCGIADGCETQIDLFIGSPSKSPAVEDCESQLTPDNKQEFYVNPPDNLPVDNTKFWNDVTGQCATVNWGN